jgi:hypothetical protein
VIVLPIQFYQASADVMITRKAPAQALRSGIAWRKILILNRRALARAWAVYFPLHDFNTLHLIRDINMPPPGWDEHWIDAAREYHEERRKRTTGYK